MMNMMMMIYTVEHGHLDPPANGQAVVYLTGLLEVFISESLNLAAVSDNSVGYQAVNVRCKINKHKRSKVKVKKRCNC